MSTPLRQTHNPEYHKTVLIDEVLAYLIHNPRGTYIDATFGGGGHTRAILEYAPEAHVIAFDWDLCALNINGPSLFEEFGERITLQHGNFAHIERIYKKYAYPLVDGILADFGTSQYQIAEQDGFSFSRNKPLDMRMSPGYYKTTAEDIVNEASEKELVHIFQEYGEEPHSRKIARAIVQARHEQRICTTKDLSDLIVNVVPLRRHMIHPATRVFQALRIVVNKELENIKTFLQHVPDCLKPGGRLVCISFHSLEDRIVKNYIRDYGHIFDNLTKKVVVPSDEEVRINPSSRSSKLRAAQKKVRE